MKPFEPRFFSWAAERLPGAISAVAVVGGLLGLTLGWGLNIAVFKTGLPGLTPIKANAAVGFMLAGASLWLAAGEPKGHVPRIASQVCAGALLLLGAASLAEYLTGADFGIDQLLFRDVEAAPGTAPGRMAENTAVCFMALGAAVLLLNARKGGRAAAIHALALTAMLISGAALVNYVYGMEELMQATLNFTPMALPTSVVLLLVGWGVVTARPEFPLRRYLTSETGAGTIVRRLLPATVFLTFLFGWAVLQGHKAGYFRENSGIATYATAVAGTLGFLILWIAARLFRADALRQQAQDELRRVSLEIEDLYNHAPCGYHSLGKDGVFLRINDTELSWLGYTREEVVGKMGWKDIIAPAYYQVLEENFPVFLKQGFIHDVEYEIVRKDGTRFMGVVNATAVFDDAGNYLFSRGVVLDITQRKLLEARLEQQARIDVLTGLNNRRYFLELAEHEISRSTRFGEPLALLMLDVDHFKQVNDRHGHDTGDAVLREVAGCCRETLRDIDILGRLGGEEFVAILPGVEIDHAMVAAERLRSAISSLSVSAGAGQEVSFTASIGVASRLAEDSVTTLLKRADIALYAAKGSGRNCVRAG